MEHLGSNSKPHSPDMSVTQSDDSPHPIRRNAKWSKCAITVHEGQLRNKWSKMGNFGAVSMSNEELKIRGELESEVERDLEDEIKDGICHLALRLHRLYQHQKARDPEFQSKRKMAAFTEVNITIRMEGESTIQIHENKKEVRNKAMPMRTQSLKLEQNQSRIGSFKEFDWARTLRSSSSFVGSSKKKENSQHACLQRNDNNIRHTAKHVIMGRGTSSINASGEGKGKVYLKDVKLLQVGWRN